MTNSAQMTKVIETARTNYPGSTGSGLPWRRSQRVINGHLVQANLFGWGNKAQVQIWVDGSSEPLSPAEALARIA